MKQFNPWAFETNIYFCSFLLCQYTHNTYESNTIDIQIYIIICIQRKGQNLSYLCSKEL